MYKHRGEPFLIETMSKSALPTSKAVGATDASYATNSDRTTLADIVSAHIRFIDEWAVYSEVSRLSEDSVRAAGDLE